MRGRLLAAVACLAALLLGCGGGGDSDGPPATSPPSSPPSTEVALAGKVQACRLFLGITNDSSLDDTGLAAAYGTLAQVTADPELAAAIRRVGEGYAQSDPSVSSEEVTELCE